MIGGNGDVPQGDTLLDYNCSFRKALEILPRITTMFVIPSVYTIDTQAY